MKDVQKLLRRVEFAFDMEQRLRFAAIKGVPTILSMEEYVRGMEQSEERINVRT